VLQPPHTTSWKLTAPQFSPHDDAAETRLNTAERSSSLAEEYRNASKDNARSDITLSVTHEAKAETPRALDAGTDLPAPHSAIDASFTSTAIKHGVKVQTPDDVHIEKSLPKQWTALPVTSKDANAEQKAGRAEPVHPAGQRGYGRFTDDAAIASAVEERHARNRVDAPKSTVHTASHRPASVEDVAPIPIEHSKQISTPARENAAQVKRLDPIEAKQRTEAGRAKELPEGNRIHIGTIDIHIAPPAAPVKAAQSRRVPVAQAALSRGFASSLGLRQG
jgi:hypothetical protein